MMLDSFKAWWAKPFDSSGSVWNWALFTLLVMVLIIGWARVIGLLEVIADEA